MDFRIRKINTERWNNMVLRHNEFSLTIYLIHILKNITDIKSKSIRCIPTKVISVVYMLILCLKDPKQGVGIVLPNWNIFHQKQLLTGPWYVIFVKAISQTTWEFCLTIHISIYYAGTSNCCFNNKGRAKILTRQKWK